MRRFTFSVVMLFIVIFAVVRSQARDGNYTYHGCLYLCWDRVVNSQLSWNELKVMVRQHGWRLGEPSRYDLDPNITSRAIRINSIDNKAQINADYSANAISWVYIAEDSTVDMVEIDVSNIGTYVEPKHPNHNTWDTFKPSNVLKTYGPPSAFSISGGYNASGVMRGVQFFWEEIGFGAIYTLRVSNDFSETVEICLELDNMWSAQFIFYKSEDSEIKVGGRYSWRLSKENNFQQITDFASLEEMTEALVAGRCFEIRLRII